MEENSLQKCIIFTSPALTEEQIIARRRREEELMSGAFNDVSTEALIASILGMDYDEAVAKLRAERTL